MPEEVVIEVRPSPPPGARFEAAVRCGGVVAWVEHGSAAIAQLTLDAKGLGFKRSATAQNGRDGFEWQANDPASVAKLLEALRCRAKLGRRIDAIALSQSLFGVQHAVLPPVKGAAWQALVRKRLREVVEETPGEWVVDTLPFRSVGASQAGGPNTLFSWADAPTLAAFRAAFRAAGLDVRRAVPPMVALMNLLVHARVANADEAEIVLFAHVPSPSIALCDGKEILYAHVLRDALVGAPEQLPEVLLTEVQRTAAYFRESKRGRRVARIVVGGLPSDAGATLCAWLTANTGMNCVPLELPGVHGAAEPPSGFEAAAPLLAGLVLHEVRAGFPIGKPVDLFPRRTSRAPRITAIAAALLVAIGGAATVRARFESEARHEQQRVDAAREESARLDRTEPQRSAERSSATRQADESIALALIDAAPKSPAQLLLEAELLVPPGLVLESSRFERASVRDLGKSVAHGATLELGISGDFTRGGVALLDRYVGFLATRPWCAEAKSRAEAGQLGESGSASDQVHVEVALR